jgi:hypothetical protein
MPVDLWSFESKVYPKIEAAGMRGERSVDLQEALGEGHNVAVKIIAIDKPLQNSRKLEAKNFSFNVNFWRDDKGPWYRVDTEHYDRETGKKMLHFHLEVDSQKFSDHKALPEDKTIGELVSYAFEEAKRYLESKKEVIAEGKDSGGFA